MEKQVQVPPPQSSLKRELSFFDVTNLVVGAIVGSDIYIASALTAGLIGPFSIVAWLIAGILAGILAIVFAYNSYYLPRVGGSFAYVAASFDDFWGFLSGWSMWIAEIISLPVFAIVFTNYLGYFITLNWVSQILVKFLFTFILTYINIRGIRQAAKLNDVLTFIKLTPLFLLVVGGLVIFIVRPGLLQNYVPFIPNGLNNIGPAIVLIFWAYAGFELAPIPADEIKNPAHTLPRAIFTGIAIVTIFYLSTNFVVYGAVKSTDLANTMTPLNLVGVSIFGGLGAIIMSVGALFSVSGSDESALMGTSRLAYAMSIDGIFPKLFAKVHPKYETPYISLIVQGIIAFVLSLFSQLRGLISFAVLNLAFSYLLTCLALLSLNQDTKRLPGKNVFSLFGILVCLLLIYYTSLWDKIIGIGLILCGIPIYTHFSGKSDIRHLKELYLSESAIFSRTMEHQNNFLAHAISHLYRLIPHKH